MNRNTGTGHCKLAVRIALPLALLAAVVLTGPCLAADWPMFRGNPQRTGYCTETVGFPQKQPAWVDSFAAPIVSSPSVAGGIVYIGGRDSTIYAIEASTGKILWRRKTGGWVDSSPFIGNGRLIVGSRDGTVYILDAASGEDISFLDAGLQLSSPAVMSDGTILSGMGFPLTGASGYAAVQPKWTRTNSTWIVPFAQFSYSSPAVYGQVAVIGANDGRLYGLDGHTGGITWSLQTGGGVYLSTPAIDNASALAYFAPGSDDAAVYAVNLLSGKPVWQSEGAPAQSLAKRLKSSPIPPGQMLALLRYRPQYRQQLIDRLLKQSGASRGLLRKGMAEVELTDADNWMPTGGLKTSSVAVDGENVYVVQKALGLLEKTTNGVQDYQYMPRFTLLALDKKTGQERWRFTELRNCIRLGYCSSPLVTRHYVFVGWGEGALYAFEKETGRLAWSDTISGDIVSSPAIADGKLFVATLSGSVYAYNLSATAPGLDFQQSTYCYPNPARAEMSHIQTYVDRPAQMIMVVYNTADKPVFRVQTGLPAGQKYVVDWNLNGVANGVYFARIKVTYSDGTSQIEKKTVKIAVLR